MGLESKNKVEPMFSMSSMTDIIFLLLIFFMLTSSFITPSGLPVSLPSSKAATVEMQKVSVTITEDLQFYVNDRKVTKSTLKAELNRVLKPGQGVVVLHIDKSVPTEHLVYVADLATQLEAKVSIATKPQ
ncbi:MAG: ExbD/TolR family protein [Candidatus Cyclobacteriaceae bacterium M2_1C_046]